MLAITLCVCAVASTLICTLLAAASAQINSGMKHIDFDSNIFLDVDIGCARNIIWKDQYLHDNGCKESSHGWVSINESTILNTHSSLLCFLLLGTPAARYGLNVSSVNALWLLVLSCSSVPFFSSLLRRLGYAYHPTYLLFLPSVFPPSLTTTPNFCNKFLRPETSQLKIHLVEVRRPASGDKVPDSNNQQVHKKPR
jgi:hypothetical protein